MAESDLPGPPLLGVRRQQGGKPNTFRPWQYLLIALVLVLGGIYAAPNLFQPDPALQIKPREESSLLDASVLSTIEQKLQDAGIPVVSTEMEGSSGWIRVDSDENQLKAQAVAAEYLNANAQDYIVALNRASNTPQWLRDFGATPMSLGLDLSGGVHFLLQVNMEEYIASVVESTADGMQDKLRSERIVYVPNRKWVDDLTITIAFNDEDNREKAEAALADYQGLQVREVDLAGKPALSYLLTDERIQALEDRAISQNLTSLRNRVNELGVSEPQVQRLGRSRIVVDLPGIQDSARAKEILNKFANLEFRLAALPNTPRFQRETYPYEGAPQDILRRNIVTGNNVQDASQGFDPETSQPQVNIELDSDGGNRMHDATKRECRPPHGDIIYRTKTSS